MLLRKLKEMEGLMPRGDQLSRQWRLIQLIDRTKGITVDDGAGELVATVRANVTIDWTVREDVRAQLRVLVKRILRKHGSRRTSRRRRRKPCWSRPRCCQSTGRMPPDRRSPHF